MLCDYEQVFATNERGRESRRILYSGIWQEKNSRARLHMEGGSTMRTQIGLLDRVPVERDLEDSNQNFGSRLIFPRTLYSTCVRGFV